ncbi:hypothetical protein GCM10022214_59840 [Actinomadura miaoliensis]|uniref:Uncharacterized protein n=1 Tax=Actinomadura miaoliensis TaxID=430685 RepID=A0ABP7WLK6_9ACTN
MSAVVWGDVCGPPCEVPAAWAKATSGGSSTVRSGAAGGAVAVGGAIWSGPVASVGVAAEAGASAPAGGVPYGGVWPVTGGTA